MAEVALLCSAREASFLRLDHRVSAVRVIAALDEAAVDEDAARAIGHHPAGKLTEVTSSRGTQWGIVLEEGYAHTDLLMLTCGTSGWLPALAAELPQIWNARRKGLVSEIVGEEGTHVAILSPRNPYALTPSEKQICHLLRDGLSAKDMAARLDVSMPTVRTHLRNIYAKTELDGMVAVMHRLHADGL
ncbi:helix-turn-helix transcriptional regulator [Pseudooctadecabacter sp.]|uniref:helix-turn-helix transcriptional regulator n=1 Tax=Pseudooctadecabacter sp. TaxID=1966338 RepID=UPI0035C804D7